MIFSIGTVVGITGIGVASFVGERILERMGRHDLKQTLEISIFIGSVLYVAYVGFNGIHQVIKMVNM